MTTADDGNPLHRSDLLRLAQRDAPSYPARRAAEHTSIFLLVIVSQ
jgi:hypothetical protein